jgi:predicted Zn finger-like uncharacterized protein
MILTCPSCGTQYVVKDGAIPPEGRQVRCAACKHSWQQDTEETGALELKDEVEVPAAAPEPVEEASLPEGADNEPASDEEESLTEATLIEPSSGPEAEERAYEEAVIEGVTEPQPMAEGSSEPGLDASATDVARPAAADWGEPPEAEGAPDMFSPFAGEDEEAPRREGGLTRLLIAALIIVVLAVAFWFLAPSELKARLGLASAGESPLQVSNPPHVERIQLASGNQLLTVSGRVINPTGREQIVPPLSAKLTNQAGKLVYSWTIAPPTRSLAAGASASFNSAEVNVPPGGEYLTITVGQKA